MAAIEVAGREHAAGRNTGSLPGLLPSIALHGALAAALWVGIGGSRGPAPVAVTTVSLLQAAEAQPTPAASPVPEIPYVIPDSLPKRETLPYEPFLNPPAPPPPAEAIPKAEPPEPQDAVALESPKPAIPPKMTADDRPKPVSKPSAAPKAKEKPPKEKPKAQEKSESAAPAPVVAQAAAAPAVVPAAVAATSQATTASQGATASTDAAPGDDAPVRMTRPEFAGPCPSRYPERALRRNLEGTVLIHALIDTEGRPFDIKVAASSGYALLDEAAQKAIAGCAFVPQQVGGRPVRAFVEIPVPFALKQR